MFIKQNSQKEAIQIELISRIEKVSEPFDLKIKLEELASKVIDGLYDGITITELDNLTAETAASLITKHPDYALLASRIAINSLHENTIDSFSETMKLLFEFKNVRTGKHTPLIADDVYEIIKNNAELLDRIIVHSRDFEFDYFGFKTLEKSYLLRINGRVVERPQHMYMRVAIGIHKSDIKNVIDTYHLLSEHWFTHASPTLFNGGTPKPQMSTCFLLTMKKDSIDGIYDTVKQVAKISQWSGGIGLSIHDIRATGSYIGSTNGVSQGIVPVLKVFNDTSRHADQGGGKRKGAFAIYLEPWHADVFEFLNLKKNHGKEEMRARDLFYALWIPDLFMKRVEANQDWSLFCPHEAPGLHECWGEAFERLYTQYETEGRARKTIKAQDLWFAILNAQVETGTPYLLYKDASNAKSNQQNLGTIKGSNLCSEIIQYTSPDEVAVCNLASLSLPKFIINGKFDHQRLYDVTYQVVLNQNKIIDNNYYPVEEARNSNLRHRPIGVGIQGLADAFILLRLPFESQAAKQLNKDIFETIYFASMTASKDLAKEYGAYESFAGSPVSKGIFQFDMWNVVPSTNWDWETLKVEVMKYGVRNSLLVAPMPTASTSQILGNNECFEPYTSNIYTRRVLSGEFIIVNKHLIKDLLQLGIWSDDMKNKIIKANGSIQNIAEIPIDIKELYKTVWEIKQRALIDMAADRGAYVCQSQSLNLFLDSPSLSKLTSMHFYAWKRGLKTGMYYLRIQAASQAVQFTIEKQQFGADVKETSKRPLSVQSLKGNLLFSDSSKMPDLSKDDCLGCTA